MVSVRSGQERLSHSQNLSGHHLGCHSTSPPGQLLHVSQHGQGAGTSDKLKWLAENGLLPLQPHQVTSAGLPLKDGKP